MEDHTVAYGRGGVVGYDVIVVGARVAGAATAMLLARRGLRVLVVDRVSFPSDTISSHQVEVPGVARRRGWGLLGRLRAASAPPTRRVRFDSGDVVLDGRFPSLDGVDALYSPRRTVLDAVLVDAARASGAEVRERFRAVDLTWSDGRVTGIRGARPGGAPVTETAPLVVGADGKHSFVSGAVSAGRYRHRPASSWTRSPPRALRPPSVTPNCSPAPSLPGSAAPGRSASRSPRTSVSGTGRSGRCTTSPPGSLSSRRAGWNGCCSARWRAGPRKSTGSSVRSPASPRSANTSLPPTCCRSSAPAPRSPSPSPADPMPCAPVPRPPQPHPSQPT